MTQNKHITRNYNANKVKKIRYDDDDFLLHIKKYDKTFETFYTLSHDNFEASSNAIKYFFDGMTCLYTKDAKNLVLTFKYDAPVTSSHYRLELLYSNTYRNTKKDKKNGSLKCNVTITVNGEQELVNSHFISTDVQYNRHYQYVKLNQGVNVIQYTLSPNMVFFGFAVKKYDVYEARRHVKTTDKITMINCDLSNTSDFKINTMKCTLMYYHGLDELLEPTNPNANRSGLVFDYRDEINYHVRDTNGNMVKVFGGYISTLDLDDNLQTLTLNCADRLIGLDRRYCLSEIYLNGRTDDGKVDYKYGLDYVKNYSDWSSALKFLLMSCEVPIKTNALIGTPLVAKKTKNLATYGKKKYNKLARSGVNLTLHDNYAYIRNNSNIDKAQSITIYDSTKKPKLINDYPNLYIEYGMGKEVWEEKKKETKTVTVNSGISTTITKQADKITKATGNAAIKPLWQWIVNNIKHTYTQNFYQTPQKTLSSKKGNCCCKSELLLDMCNYKGVTDLKYVHVTKGPKVGHVFTKINGMYVDPSTRNGWGIYAKGYGAIGSGKTTNYPTKPF